MIWVILAVLCIVVATLGIYQSAEEEHVYWNDLIYNTELIYDWGEFRVKDSNLLILIPVKEREEAFKYITENFEVEYHNNVLTYTE